MPASLPAFFYTGHSRRAGAGIHSSPDSRAWHRAVPGKGKPFEAGLGESEPRLPPPPCPLGSWLVPPGTLLCLMATRTGPVLCTCAHSLLTRTTVSGWTSPRKVRGTGWGPVPGQEPGGGHHTERNDLEETEGSPGQFLATSCPAGKRESPMGFVEPRLGRAGEGA